MISTFIKLETFSGVLVIIILFWGLSIDIQVNHSGATILPLNSVVPGES